ncbi:MAG TPA: hypothetical protein DCZ13_02530 [Porticoccaceae bacterium]|nr:hypothetical protein [Porticoccaceae bacterium]
MMWQFWQLLAGLGLFIYAMSLLEKGLRGVSTQSLRKLIRDQTRSPLRGTLVGTLTTAFLQSSSLVGLLAIAFVGANILPLQNALGVVFGANLGTTVTGWLVTTFGFKLDLGASTLPLLALGSLGVVLSKSGSRVSHYCAIVLAVGLLLTGLEWMKQSMSFVSESVDPELFVGYPLLVYFLGGAIFTALVQSSSATMVIVLSAVFAGLFPLTTAAAIAVGSDLGTTTTVLLGAIRAGASARRVALAHFVFNLTVDILAFAFLYPLLGFIEHGLGVTDPMYALVCFHSLFNLLGIVLFLPFTGHFAAWLEKRWRSAMPVGRLSSTPVTVPEAAFRAVREEAIDLCLKTILLNTRALRVGEAILPGGNRIGEIQRALVPRRLTYEEQYQDIKYSEEQILRYSYRLSSGLREDRERAALEGLLDAVRDASYSAKSLKDVRGNLLDLRNQVDSTVVLTDLRNRTTEIYQLLVNMLEQPRSELVDEQLVEIRTDVAQTHDLLHDAMIKYFSGVQRDISLPTLFNINRELFVSTESLVTAVELLLVHREFPATSVQSAGQL